MAPILIIRMIQKIHKILIKTKNIILKILRYCLTAAILGGLLTAMGFGLKLTIYWLLKY